MAKASADISDAQRAFIERQPLFFVATAPVAAGGHVNLSPKGLDALRVLGPREVAYLDLVGSGAETIAHVRENGRITLMFCAFEGPPTIVRLYGTGEVVEPQDPAFDLLRSLFGSGTGGRSVVRVRVHRVSDSCGFGVPLLEYRGQRAQLADWTDRKDPAALRDYQRQKNASSIDGLPALRWTDDD